MQSLYQKVINISNEDISTYIDSSNCEIYHYTSPSGLNGILQNHTLRFTDRNYLNDYSEGRYVMELCINSRFELGLPKEYRKHFKDHCKKLYDNPTQRKRHVYQCSFSTDFDNLSLWNYYTKSDGIKGYNVGFDANTLLNNLITNDSLPPKHQIKIFSGKVVYDQSKQKAIIKKVVKDFAKVIDENKDDRSFCNITVEIMVEKIFQVGSFFKSPCFKNESEYRLLVFLVAIWDENNKDIKFMQLNRGASTYEKNGLLIPYIDIEFNRSALSSISISPTLSFEEISGNIKNALKLHSYSDDKIKLEKSKIPVRY